MPLLQPGEEVSTNFCMSHAPNSNLLRRTVTVPTSIYITKPSSSNILIIGFEDVWCKIWWRGENCTSKIDLNEETPLGDRTTSCDKDILEVTLTESCHRRREGVGCITWRGDEGMSSCRELLRRVSKRNTILQMLASEKGPNFVRTHINEGFRWLKRQRLSSRVKTHPHKWSIYLILDNLGADPRWCRCEPEGGM